MEVDEGINSLNVMENIARTVSECFLILSDLSTLILMRLIVEPRLSMGQA